MLKNISKDISNRIYGMARMIGSGTLAFEGIYYLGESPIFTEGVNFRTCADFALRLFPVSVFGYGAYEGLKDAEDGTVHGLTKKLDKKI
jgi:hypothetical protein